MSTIDDTTLREWLDQDLDGELEARHKARLDERLAENAALVAERRSLGALHELLAESRIPVREGFRGDVMAALPVASWEPARYPVWAVPMALALSLGLGAAALFLQAGSESHLMGTGAAMVDFLQVCVLAGAGLIGASWHGIGLGIEELMTGTGLGLAAFAVLVVFLNLLFFSLLRRRPAAAESSAHHPDRS